ncbi:MAG: hypothetical protein U9R79_08625 [Armatimonadota bacterium]|nr:hypothetical protein [Armatimonadota bacterium]
MREEDVTRYVAQWLEDLGWCLISVHYPGTSGGLRLSRSGESAKSEGAIIPDIIAAREAHLLIVESKPEYCESDLAKVRAIKDDPRYRSDLVRAAAMVRQPLRHVVVGVCFAGAPPHDVPCNVLLLRCHTSGIEMTGIPSGCRHLFESSPR